MSSHTTYVLQKKIRQPSFPLSPGPGEVYLYRDSRYQSYVWRIKDSIPNLNVLNARKVISSVKVGPNTKCVLYSETNYGGNTLIVERDTERLGDWNDTAVSVKVFTTM